MKFSFEIKYVPQDKWIGLYHEKNPNYLKAQGGGTLNYSYGRTFYLCLIPCFPIIFRRKFKTT